MPDKHLYAQAIARINVRTDKHLYLLTSMRTHTCASRHSLAQTIVRATACTNKRLCAHRIVRTNSWTSRHCYKPTFLRTNTNKRLHEHTHTHTHTHTRTNIYIYINAHRQLYAQALLPAGGVVFGLAHRDWDLQTRKMKAMESELTKHGPGLDGGFLRRLYSHRITSTVISAAFLRLVRHKLHPWR